MEINTKTIKKTILTILWWLILVWLLFKIGSYISKPVAAVIYVAGIWGFYRSYLKPYQNLTKNTKIQ